MLPGPAELVRGLVVMKCAAFPAADGGNYPESGSNVTDKLIASAPVHLGTDEIQRVGQPSMLISTSQCQRRHAANTNYWYCWTSADLQK